MKQQSLKKLSTALALMMLIALVMPTMAFAAQIVSFYYDTSTGNLSGAVYTDDPDSVHVVVHPADGTTVTDLTYGNFVLGSEIKYDDNNNKFYTVTNQVYMGQAPSSIETIINGQPNSLAKINFSTDVSYSYSDTTVTLDVYRINAAQYFSDSQPSQYMQPGAKLASFTPVASGSDSVQIFLPRNSTDKATLHSETGSIIISPSDFKLTDQTMGQDVTFSQLSWSTSTSSYADDLFIKADSDFTVGHTYVLELSSSAGGNEILIPGAGYYNVNVYVGNTLYYQPSSGVNIPYFDSVEGKRFYNIAVGTPPQDNSNNDGGSNNDDNVIVPPPPVEPKTVVNENSLKNGKDGKVSIEIAHGSKEVLLPAHAADIVGSNKLELKSDKFIAEIPAEVLQALQDLIPEAELEDSQISFTAEVVGQTVVETLLDQAESNAHVTLRTVGEVLEFNIGIATKDGKKTKLERFDQPLKLKLKVSDNANTNLLGVYYIADNGTVEYVGGTYEEGYMNAKVHHFSKYGVLEYDKTFSDVAAENWSANAIKQMAAKHIIEGINSTEFAPDRNVTRAEFAAMLVRALQLTANEDAQFKDIEVGKWYASSVAAANEAGIVFGRSETKFAPNETISREEMAVMIARAYTILTGQPAETKTGDHRFDDQKALSSWASDAVNAAYELGIIQGKNGNLFDPQGKATRAESAQVISKLY